MQTTYTAQELYERIQSYDLIEYWGNQNNENICMIMAKTSSVTLEKGRKYSYISIEQRFDSRSDVLCCCCDIVGNIFYCDEEKRRRSAHLTITSDCTEAAIFIVLEKINL